MALEINAQFNQFVQFAEDRFQAGKRTAIARVVNTAPGLFPEEGADPLAGRTIVAKTGDFIGNIGRFRASRDVNNAARDLFRQAVADMFGGESKIPDSVKDAMKLQDYGHGKPLTARRILAVKAAVEQAKAQLQQVQGELLTNAGMIAEKNDGVDANEAAARAKTAIDAAGADVALVGILKNPKMLSELLIDGNGFLRSADVVTKRVDGLKANVDELRQATQGDKAMFQAGLRALVASGGKPIPAGIVGKIAQLAKAADIRDIADLKANSGIEALHAGLLQFHSAVEKIITDSRAMTAFKGGTAGEEYVSMRRLVGSMLLGRLSDAKMEAVQDLLAKPITGKLLGAYGNLVDTNLKIPDVSDAVRAEMVNVADGLMGAVSRIKEIAADAVGERGGLAEELDVPKDDQLVSDVAGNILEEAQESLARKKQSIANTFVSGDGQGSGIIRDVIIDNFANNAANLGDVEPMIATRMDRSVGSMINWNIMSACKQLATGDVQHSLFARDLTRMSSITIGGQKLSTDLNTALDQIARFVTGTPQATYRGLAGEDRAKAHVVMSFVSQESSKAAFNGTSLALSKDNNTMPFDIDAEIGTEDDRRTLEISFAENGDLVVKHEYERPVRTIIENGGEPTIEDMQRPTDGRSIKTGFTYTLNARTLKHISKLDFAKFDDTQARKIEDAHGPDNGPDNGPDKMRRIVESFAPEFQISEKNGNCDATFKAELG